MKLYAEIIFRNEDGIEISRVRQEETRQYMGLEFLTIHEFYFTWKVGENYSKIECVNGMED